MPGQLKVRFVDCDGGRTPAKSVLAWLEYGLALTPEQHKVHLKKPYVVRAKQQGGNVCADITLASTTLLSKALEHAQTAKHAINGKWVKVEILEGIFVPVEQILEHAPPRRDIRVKTSTPIISVNHGFDDPYLSKQRLFEGIMKRWEFTESTPVPSFSKTENVELLTINGCSKPFYTFAQHRGWDGMMDLKFHGNTERVVNGNALLAYGSMWGIGKGTTVGAGQFEVMALPRRVRG